MTTSSKKPNWFYIIIGIIATTSFIWNLPKDIHEDELNTKTIILKSEVYCVKDHKSDYSHKFRSTNYQGTFVIEKGSIVKDDMIDSLRTGDTIIVQIHKSRVDDLNIKSEEIPIYSIQKNNSESIFTFDSYLISQRNYRRRWNTLIIPIGLIFVVRGMKLISSILGFILCGTSIIIILTLMENKILP